MKEGVFTVLKGIPDEDSLNVSLESSNANFLLLENYKHYRKTFDATLPEIDEDSTGYDFKIALTLLPHTVLIDNLAQYRKNLGAKLIEPDDITVIHPNTIVNDESIEDDELNDVPEYDAANIVKNNDHRYDTKYKDKMKEELEKRFFIRVLFFITITIMILIAISIVYVILDGRDVNTAEVIDTLIDGFIDLFRILIGI